MGAHIVNGLFQSDKYPMCPPGKVPLSVTDVTAQDLLYAYAQRRRAIDAEFSDDLEACLQANGFVPNECPTTDAYDQGVKIGRRIERDKIVAKSSSEPGAAVDDTLLPWDEEDNALAQGISPFAVDDAHVQGVAAGRMAEREKIVAWLRSQSEQEETSLKSRASEINFLEVVATALIMTAINHVIHAIQDGKHDL